MAEVQNIDPENTKTQGRVLVVDDEKNIRTSVQLVLGSQGFTVDLADEGVAAEKILSATPPDVILLDVRMPGRSGLELLKEWKVLWPQIPIILMSGEATITEALAGLKDGAYDFIEKPFLQPRLINAIGRAVERSQLRQSIAGSAEDRIVGESAVLKQVLKEVEKVAPLKTRVLITGESGTGKDLLARAIHRLSSRAKKRFVKINCAAIPGDLIESELFGHVKGAFTGAVTARKGLFEGANGGTLFLDEIGELSLSAQAKILRALQNGEITPVGSDITITVDVRIVAATNKDLKALVEAGAFREDLYYRLAVVTFENPPLRSRPEDISMLTQFFVEQIRIEHGLPPKELDAAVTSAMARYPWPGNVRELRNVIERFLILSGPTVHTHDLPSEISSYVPKAVASGGANSSDSMNEKTLPITTWEKFKLESERNYLIRVLKYAEGNISEAARLLGVERTTVHKWLNSMQISKQHYLV